MSKIEKQQDNIKTLLQLIAENPDLEIVPMVDSEIVGDDSYTTWRGSWGKAELDEYYVTDERIYFKEHDFEDLVNDEMDRLIEADVIGDYEELAKKKVEALSWVKAIVVNITTA